jgi:hypothetical protein
MRTVGYFIASMVIGCFASCKSTPQPVPPKPPPEKTVDPAVCELAEKAEIIWNEDVRDSLDLSVKIIEGTIEAWEAENFTRQLDEFTSNWILESESACREHYFEQTTPAETYRKQASCFEDLLRQCRDIIELMRGGDHAAIERSSVLEDTLESCL